MFGYKGYLSTKTVAELLKHGLYLITKVRQNKKRANEISEAKHQAGISSALNVLDAKIAFLAASQNQASAKKEQIANLIALYKVMGGGAELEVE